MYSAVHMTQNTQTIQLSIYHAKFVTGIFTEFSASCSAITVTEHN